MRKIFPCFALAGALAAVAAPAFAQEQVAELIRRAQEGVVERGWCRNVDWPSGSGDSYIAWLENARVGHAKANSFKNGSHCQFDFITRVYQGDRGRCVTYTWFSCGEGSRCSTGQDTDCKIGGEWVRQ